MELHAKLVRAQLNFFKPFVANCSLEVTRKGQDKLGELMTAIHKREVYVREHDFGGFQGAWLTPKDKRRTGVVLYLHGGGRGAMKPFCINPDCKNFLPEEKRGYRKKPAAAESAEQAADEVNLPPEPAAAPDTETTKTAKKPAAKKTAAKKPAAKKTASAKTAAAKKTATKKTKKTAAEDAGEAPKKSASRRKKKEDAT